MVKLTYEKVKETFENSECVLLTTKEEFEKFNMNSKSHYKIISKCGHENTAKYDMFKAQNCGLLCKKCVSRTATTPIQGTSVEYAGFCVIRDAIKDKWEVCKMVEGTRADFAVRPKDVDADEWLPIQLKVTQKPNELHSNNYRFTHTNKGYDDMVVMCFCLHDKRTWMFNGSERVAVCSIHIGSIKSKYSNDEVEFLKLSEKLMEFYASIAKQTLDILNIPIGMAQQREQKYRRMRETFFPYVEFIYPEEEALKFDFKVDNKKVQEKVATQVRKRGKLVNGYCVKLCNSKPYKKGDNDFYWFNIPDSKYFYLIPESVLELHAFIQNETNTTKTKSLYLYPNTNCIQGISEGWVNDYLFEYDKMEKDVFLDIIATGKVEPNIYENKSRDIATYKQKCRENMANAVGVNLKCYKDGILIGDYPSISEAARSLNIKLSTLNKQVQVGGEVEYKGYKFVKGI